jgi:preprotein translocase subunit SecF
MEFFKTPNIDFVGKRKYFYALSAILAVLTVGSIILHKGVNPSIDFAGGTLVQGFFKTPVQLGDVRKSLSDAGLEGAELQSVPFHNAVIVRFKEGLLAKEMAGNQVSDLFAKTFVDNPFTVERVEFVGPVVGKHLMVQTLWAIIFSLAGICIYVAFRFKRWVWGATGVLALIHDVFLTVGFMSVSGREMSVTVVAALLTLAGYSINDTIVIFDRIRENLRARRKEPLDVLINRSLNETLSRTIITSLTVFIVLLSLLFFGGQVLSDFSVALTFGVVVGSYSTLFIATPLVYDWQKNRRTPLW